MPASILAEQPASDAAANEKRPLERCQKSSAADDVSGQQLAGEKSHERKLDLVDEQDGSASSEDRSALRVTSPVFHWPCTIYVD